MRHRTQQLKPWTVRPRVLARALAVWVPLALVLPGLPGLLDLGWFWLRLKLADEVCVDVAAEGELLARPGACE